MCFSSVPVHHYLQFKNSSFIILFLHLPLIFTRLILSLKHKLPSFFSSLLFSEWTFRGTLSEPCLVFTSLGLQAEQRAEAGGLEVKHQIAFGRPNSVFQSPLSCSSCPQRCATTCTSCALNLTNAEQHNCSKAAELPTLDLTRQLWSAFWIFG